MVTQVLILNHQLTLTVTIKQALERTGSYSVHPFTNADSALDYLRDHPQQVALVDMELPGIRGDALVARLREIQPDLPIIASPSQDPGTISRLGLRGSIKATFTARDLLPLLEEYAPAADGQEAQDAPQLIERTETPASLRTRILNVPTRDPGATRAIDQPADQPPVPTDSLDGESSSPSERAGTGTLPLPGATDLLRDRMEDRPGTSHLTDVLRDYSANPPGTSRLTDALDRMSDADFDPDEALLDMDATPSDPGTDAPPQPHSDLLSRLDLSASQPAEPPTVDQRFTDLVNSMRRGGPTKPLPQRSQPFVDFILTGGMDTLLTEIERSKGSTQPFDADSAFQRLADEEPPMPSLEESGTVGDLMSGVTDPGFRNVLAMLSGDQPTIPTQAQAAEEPGQMTAEEIDEAFSSYYQSNVAPTRELMRPRTPTAPLPQDREEEPDVEPERTPARMILETALDESTPIDSFSLENLIASIDRQLPDHRPNVQPLPSWLRDTNNVNFALSQPQIEEPDFLIDGDPLFATPEEFSIETTRPSSAVLPESGVFDFVTDSLDVSPRTQPISARAEVPPAPPEIGDETQITPAHGVPSAEPAFDFDAEFDADLFEDEAEPEPEAEAPAPPPVRPPVEASWLDLDMIDTLNLLEDYEQETVAHDHGPQPLDPRFERLMNIADEDEDSGPPIQRRRKPRKPAQPPPELPEVEPGYAEVVEPTEAETQYVEPVEAPDLFAAEWPTEEPAAEAEPEPFAEAWPDEAPEFAFEEPASEAEPELYAAEWPTETPEFLPEQPAAEAEPELYAAEWPEEPEPAPEPMFEAQPLASLGEPAVEETEVSQLALSLTQASLELTANATLLTRGRDIVAAAGELAQEDIVELRRVIKDDWDAGGDEARMRFVTLPSSGKDYLVYSRRTIDDLTLTMLFAGNKPLRDIRRQERRLLEALEAVPEKVEPPPLTAPEPEPRAIAPRTPRTPSVRTQPTVPALPAEVAEEAEPVTRTAYALVWILRDPTTRLSEPVVRAISSGLRTQLGAQQWNVQALDAQDEFVYVLADIPGETAPPEIIRDLKRRSAQIATSLDPSLRAADLWADSYLVVTPGQPLDEDDIQQYINFQRMD